MAFLIIILLIILNGYFSLAEIALIAVSSTEVADEQNRNDLRASQVLKLIKDPESFLSAVQVGITLVGLLEGIYGGDVIVTQLNQWFLKSGMGSFAAHAAAIAIGIGAITYLTIVFGELVPKSIALQIPLRISLIIAPSLVIFSRCLYPFIKMLTVGTRFILSTLSIKRANNKKISENDLKSMLSTAYQQGLLGKQQFWMYENLFSFEDLKAKNIMKPARIVICLAYDSTREQINEEIKKHPYSHFPIFKNSPQNIVGVLFVMDFFLNESLDWHQCINRNCSVPQDASVRDVFNTFRDKQVEFGIVSGEHNDFLGVVSMQDIMEGVFGDLPELEDYKTYFYQKSERVWVAESFIHLQRLRNVLNLPWLRQYEKKYISLSDFFKGEASQLSDDGTITIDGVEFKIVSGSVNDLRTVQIVLPDK